MYEVCRSRHPGLIEVIYQRLDQAEAYARCVELNATLPNQIKLEYFIRPQPYQRRRF